MKEKGTFPVLHKFDWQEDNILQLAEFELMTTQAKHVQFITSV